MRGLAVPMNAGGRDESRPYSVVRVGARFIAPAGVVLIALALCLCGLFLANRIAGAQAPVEMTATVDRDVVTVGDRIRVTVTLRLPEPAQADLTSLESQFGDLELVLVGLPRDALLGDGRREVQQTYEVAAFRVGTVELPALSLVVRLPDGANATATTAPAAINVQSVIPPDENPTDVRDLKPQIAFPLVSGIQPRTVALIVAAVALALAALLLLWRRLRRPRAAVVRLPVAPPSAEAAARAELDRIASLRLLEKGEIKQLHALLAACIRRYLTARYAFPAFAMTTTELRRRMDDHGVGRWQARLVAGLLVESDAVNFAQYIPAYTRCEQNLEMAYGIVDAGEPLVDSQPPQAAPASA